jgi:NAD+ synthase (glutamine-hydrolysing)
MSSLRIALAQLNATVGDLDGNRRRIVEAIARAAAWRADILLTPELSLTGYPPEDLLLKPAFIDETRRALERLAPSVRGLVALVGWVQRAADGALHNAAAVLAQGRLLASYHKQCLPNYGVFDEARYFRPGRGSLVLDAGGSRLGVTICEDLWRPDPADALARAGCQAVLNLSASPYHAGKLRDRVALFAQRAQAHGMALAYCNLVGGQDELVFDGGSLAMDAQGRPIRQAPQFAEELLLVDLPLPARRASPGRAAQTVAIPAGAQALPSLPPARRRRLTPSEEVYEALVLGTRDYVRKNGFDTVVLGLSGGIDSSLVACVAADALGPDRVVGVLMPSRFTSTGTREDAEQLARNLGLRADTLPIEPCFEAYLDTLKDRFAGRAPDATEQNLQARIRGNLLMALSNKFGWLVLTTGNKSELATGYCTLYGDMAGGFAVIKDVPKTLVYELSRMRNRRGAVIPQRVFDRPPTAELAPNQTDQDTLPPYGELDRILKAYVEEELGVAQIVRRGLGESVVRRVIRMIDTAEYKRRQAPPGVKITPRAFGKDRRMPITNRYQQA